MGLLKEATPERSDPSVQCSPDLCRRGEAEMRLPRSSQSDGWAHFCLCTHVFFLPYELFTASSPVLEASGTPVILVLPAPHLSLCTRVQHYFRDFHPVPWGLHLLSQVPNLFSLSFCRNHFNSLPIWLASLRCPSDPWPFAHSSHSQSGTEHFCKGQC